MTMGHHRTVFHNRLSGAILPDRERLLDGRGFQLTGWKTVTGKAVHALRLDRIARGCPDLDRSSQSPFSELAQVFINQLDGQAHDVRVRSVDTLDEPGSQALDGVG